MKEIIKLDHIQKYYGNGGNITKAIQDISFSVQYWMSKLQWGGIDICW